MAKRNPVMTVGQEFYQNALDDYQEWRVKWWREAVQNAVDAGAAKIHLAINESADEPRAVRVSCQDDGSGMDRDTLVNKFLVLGASGKKDRTQGGKRLIGGFGKAKELLVLPWIKWSIRSQDYEAIGSGIQYDIYDRPMTKGLELAVVMKESNSTGSLAAMEFLQNCNLPGVKVWINDLGSESLFKDKLPTGALLQELEYGKVYVNGKKQRERIVIRADGIFMFNYGHIPSELKAAVIVEIEQDTTELLTANRDSFRSWRAAEPIDDLLQKIATEKKRAIRKKKGLIREVWPSDSPVTPEQGFTEVLSVVQDAGIDDGQELTEEVLENIVAVIGSLPRDEQDPAGMPSVEVARTMLVEAQTTTHEATAHQLAWSPPILVLNEDEGFRVPAKFKKDTMAEKVKELLKLWTECCRWVFIQKGTRSAKWGVGFIFSESALAAYQHATDGEWLLINPYVDVDKHDKMLTLSSREDIKSVYACAVHECTHMADGFSAHDSAFAAALTRNFAHCADGFDTVTKVAEAIKSSKRSEKTKTKTKTKQTKGKGYTLIPEVNLLTSTVEWELYMTADQFFDKMPLVDEALLRVYMPDEIDTLFGESAVSSFMLTSFKLHSFESRALEERAALYGKSPELTPEEIAAMLAIRLGLSTEPVDVEISLIDGYPTLHIADFSNDLATAMMKDALDRIPAENCVVSFPPTVEDLSKDEAEILELVAKGFALSIEELLAGHGDMGRIPGRLFLIAIGSNSQGVAGTLPSEF